MTVIFKGDFETGDLFQFGEVFGNPQVIIEAAKNGSYGARCVTTGIGSEASLERVGVYKKVPARRFYYAQCMMKLNQDLIADGNRVTVISMRGGTGPAGSCGFKKVGSVLRWYITKASMQYASSGPIVGQWHYVELYQDDATGGGLKLYIDGVEVLTQAEAAGGFLDGVIWGAITNVNYAVSVDIDDCVISDTYIGMEPPKPKLTIASSPELNVPVYVDEKFVGNTPIAMELPSGTHTVRVEDEVVR